MCSIIFVRNKSLLRYYLGEASLFFKQYNKHLKTYRFHLDITEFGFQVFRREISSVCFFRFSVTLRLPFNLVCVNEDNLLGVGPEAEVGVASVIDLKHGMVDGQLIRSRELNGGSLSNSGRDELKGSIADRLKEKAANGGILGSTQTSGQCEGSGFSGEECGGDGRFSSQNFTSNQNLLSSLKQNGASVILK